MDKSKAHKALLYIRSYMAHHGWPPTLQEIGFHLKVSRQRAHQHCQRLHKAGLLKRLPSKTRNYGVVAP